jgi:ACS family hexuronate transporter-like MFS transporter
MSPPNPSTGDLRIRWLLLALVSIALIINSLDRQVLSVLAPTIRHELHLTNSDYGIILFCFLLGMASFQVPNGLLMDRAGRAVHSVLSCPVWSVASMLHGLARWVLQFGLLRFSLGAAECGNYTGGLKLVAQRFPVRERGLAGGIFNSCTLVASVIAPPVVAWLALHFSWRTTFLVTSSTGFVWVVVWRAVYPRTLDAPAPKPRPVVRTFACSDCSASIPYGGSFCCAPSLVHFRISTGSGFPSTSAARAAAHSPR